MKKITYVLAFAFVAGLILSSCEKKDDENKSTQESSKASLETNGSKFSTSMESLVDKPAVDVAANLITLMESFDNDMESKALLEPIYGLAGVQSGITQSKIKSLLQPYSIKEDGDDDPVDFKAEWDSIVGTYTWNFANEEFDKEANSSAIVVKFPGMETETTNTAELTISNFAVKALTGEIEGFEAENILTSIKVSLKYNGSVITSVEYSGGFGDNIIPTALNVTVTVDNFSFSSALTHTPYTKASLKWTIKEDDAVIVELFQEVAGNWSEDNINNNVTKVVDSNEYYYDEYTEVDIENILSTANAYVQIYGIKIAGNVNAKALATKVKEIDEKYEDSDWTLELDKQMETEYADALNANASLSVIDTESNTKLADAQAYAKLDPADSEYDEDNYEMAINMIFGDGSKVDAETYFKGLDETFSAFEDMVDELATLFDFEDDDYDYEQY